MITEIISAILQLIIFTAIPFIVYLIKERKTEGFLEYIGLKRSNQTANVYAIILSLLTAVPLILMAGFSSEFFSILSDPASMTGKFQEMGVSVGSIFLLIIAAVFKTALSEEILFRGFIAKRLIAITNFKIGNILHAVLFGLIHTALFFFVTDSFFFLLVIFVFPAASSYLKVIINEKVADGSIVPGWIAHAVANLLSYSIIGFLM